MPAAKGLLLFWLLACGCEREQQARAEAGQLCHAIDALRKASNRDKRERLRELEKLTCSTATLCELKQGCERAYRRHVAALGGVARIQQELDAGAPAELERRLDATRSELLEAERAMQVCVTKQAEARERYQVDW